jgi:hypothetical protein
MDNTLQNDHYLESLKDGLKHQITPHGKYFMIDDRDLRIYDKNKQFLLEINTYPNDPRSILKLINHFH